MEIEMQQQSSIGGDGGCDDDDDDLTMIENSTTEFEDVIVSAPTRMEVFHDLRAFSPSTLRVRRSWIASCWNSYARLVVPVLVVLLAVAVLLFLIKRRETPEGASTAQQCYQDTFPSQISGDRERPVCFDIPSGWKEVDVGGTQNSCLGTCAVNQEAFGACSKSATCPIYTDREQASRDLLPGFSYASPNLIEFNNAWEGMMHVLENELVQLHPRSDESNKNNHDDRILYKASRAHIALQYFCCVTDTVEHRKAVLAAQEAHQWPSINITFSESIGCITYNDQYIDSNYHNTSYLALVPDDESQTILFQVVRDWETTLHRFLPDFLECRTGLFHATLMAIRNKHDGLPVIARIHNTLQEKWKRLRPATFTIHEPDFSIT